ncbi:MAG: hypothetical protein H0X38_01765 [Planctomycetes bacterium]|nr:hypothetical protein [Planctomycetota bacterium]
MLAATTARRRRLVPSPISQMKRVSLRAPKARSSSAVEIHAHHWLAKMTSIWGLTLPRQAAQAIARIEPIP